MAKEHKCWEELPPQGLPVKVTGIDWDGWGTAYYGPAKTPSDPTAEYNTKLCWRWCNDEDEITNPPTRWKHIDIV